MAENKPNKMQVRFKEIRTTLKLGQLEFEKLTGIKQSHISAIERGAKNITAGIILSLVDKVDINRIPANDQMVLQFNIQQIAGRLQLVRHHNIGAVGPQNAIRVIMRRYNFRRQAHHPAGNNHLRIKKRVGPVPGIKAAPANHLVRAVQKQNIHLLLNPDQVFIPNFHQEIKAVLRTTNRPG